jgi:hypothetical protein
VHPQEVVKLAKILHGELLLQGLNGAPKEIGGGGCEDNIINIE